MSARSFLKLSVVADTSLGYLGCADSEWKVMEGTKIPPVYNDCNYYHPLFLPLVASVSSVHAQVPGQPSAGSGRDWSGRAAAVSRLFASQRRGRPR